MHDALPDRYRVLRTYTHLMPSSEEKARAAVDRALGEISHASQTAQTGL